MAVESIGALYPTKSPGLADAADIQAALRAYHYGSYSYSTANTSPASLEANSIAKFLYDIETDIAALEARPSSGGNAQTTQPAPGDFTPADIPDGYIWVDSDGTLGGVPTGATAVFTNSAPTTSLTTGTIWVDKDATAITSNPFIPQAVINAKGDLIAGSANDTATVLSVGTNGYVLAASSATGDLLAGSANDSITVLSASTNGYVLITDSSTTSGLTWANSAASTQTLTNKSISLATNTITSTLAQLNTAVSDADVASLAGSETLTNKTLTTPVLTDPKISLTYSAKTDNYTFVTGDEGKVFSMNAATAKEFRIPTDATFNFAVGTQFNVFWITGVGQPSIVAVTPGTTTVISTGATSASPLLRVANSVATCLKIAANSWIVTGDIA